MTRLGSVTPRKVDVRVIAASNRDVPELIAQEQFLEDLYYRQARGLTRRAQIVPARHS